MTQKYDVIIVGGGAAGVSAGVEAKSVRPSSSVALVADEKAVYRRASLTYTISGHLKSDSAASIYPGSKLKELGIDGYFSNRVISLDTDKRAITLKGRGGERGLAYRNLVLATGSKPVVPSVPGVALDGVFSVKWINDALRLSSLATLRRRACVIGAGFAGLEVGQALVQRGLSVTLIEMRDQILPELLEPELSTIVGRQMERLGMEVLVESRLEGILGKDHVEYVVVNGRRLRTDLVVFATGVRPNVELAVDSGLKLGRTGAMATDRRLRTSVESVYAAGDCAETLDAVTRKVVYRPLGTVAARSGEIAGSNAAGKRREYEGFLRRQYDRIFGVEVVSMGLSTYQAKKLGLKAVAVGVEVPRPAYPALSILKPSRSLLTAITEKRSQTIVGWEGVGKPIRTSWYSKFLERLILNHEKLNSIQEIGLVVKP